MISISNAPEAVAASDAMKRATQMAGRFAQCTAPVLITGESGTGKEVISRSIHEQGARSARKYVRVNCAALSESLFESELFGHEAGSFTGATSQRIGRFELATGGTLLLDEISEIPPRLQAKLLRVLEEGEFERVGGNQPQQTDVRVLATSNRNLLAEVAKGQFREDLYYRLSVLEIAIPPLRERRDDILPLMEFFLSRFASDSIHEQPISLDNAARQRLRDFDWPGNVRQLRNVAHQICVLAPKPRVEAIDLPLRLAVDSEPNVLSLFDVPLREAERMIIEKCLARHQGNKTAAARQLGVTARTLHNKLRQYADAS